jgi:hypothetical protein
MRFCIFAPLGSGKRKGGPYYICTFLVNGARVSFVQLKLYTVKRQWWKLGSIRDDLCVFLLITFSRGGNYSNCDGIV